MIYLIDHRAFQGPVVDMRVKMKAWMESKIGLLEEWPGKPEGWTAPWPNFNNALVQSYYYRRSLWHQRAAQLLPEFCGLLLLEGYVEHEIDDI